MAVVERHLSDDGWTSEVHSPDSAPDCFREGAAIKAMWDTKRDGDNLPSWRNFAFEDFFGWHGWVALEEIIPSDTYDSIFRLWGTKLADTLKVDLTNKRFSDAVGTVYGPEEVAFWQGLSKTHNILLAEGKMDWLEHYHYLHDTHFYDLTLPLADDGRTVDRYLTVTLVTRG